ncbi:MAG: immunoglobulin domain-containing protein, partial [Verrucomicrobia bacterium]|nr:immunoglobulin domain-containing protein [Verrucomicrobiota bacterium]
MLTGKAAGTVTVRARYYTGTSYTPTAIPAAFTISTATKRVNVYELSSLEINGPDKVTVGGTVNFTCTANYSNGTRSAVKPTWSISSGGVYGSIYPSVDGFTGIFTGKADGIVTVQAQFTDSGVTKTVTKNVTVGVILNSLTIYGKSSVNVGSTSIYTCKATYSDGSTKTVTPIWSISSGGSYASITSGGVLTGNAAGSVGIKASYTEGGVTQTEVVRVTITTVVVKPSIETQPRSQTVTEGSSVTFSVTASGSTPLNYQWKKNGTAISGATSASYTIKSATTSDAGSYTVTVSNSAGSVTSSAATLTVGGKPSITTQPKSQTVDEDSSVTFSVAASGTAPLSYQWYKGSRKISGATSSTYKINSVKSSDAGSYYVVVGNSAGSVTSSGAMLNVLVKPGITTQPKSQTVTEGSSVTFSVVVEGDSNSNHYQTVSSDSPSGIEGDKAVVFNGVDYLCGWTDQLFDVTKPITIETWVYIDPASEKSIEGFVSYGKTLKIGCTSDHYFVFTMSGVEDVKSSIPVDPVNGWQHLAAAWTPGVGVTFYFNGMEWETVETTAMPNAPTKEIVNDLKVYRITVGAEALDYPTQGMMDRVRIHQAVLSEGELDSEAANPKSIRSNTLCAFDFNNEAKLLSSSTTTSVIVPNYLAASNDSPSGKVGDMSGKFNGIGGGYGTFDTEPLDLTKPVTWEAWVNVDIGRVTNYEEYFRIGNTFKIGANADHFFEVTLAGVVDIPSTVVQMSAGGGWSHVAAVWEPGVGVTFYQDGFEYERVEATQLPNAYGNKIISIGSNNSGGNNFKGKLDRMRIYNRILSDSELDADPANPKPVGDAVLAWDFNQETLPFKGEGSSAVDITSGLAMLGDRTQIAWSDSTPARDADPELLGGFSVFVDNKGSGDYANKYGIFDCDTIDFGDPNAADFDASFTLEAWFKGLSK